MSNIKLLIEYDGSNYCGWQRQLNGLSIQQVIEDAILKLTNQKITINGSGRTDARVHAKGQVASFKLNSSIPPKNLYKALNQILPDDIKCLSSEEVEDDFHARYSATGKHYRYILVNREVSPAINRNYVMNVKENLDVQKMKQGATYFIGTHDFASFMAANSSVKNTVRTIHKISVRKYNQQIFIDVWGSGFLYNMVRIMVGTLIEVGKKKIQPREIEIIISHKKRQLAGKTAMAYGLTLEEVFYK
ncbi:MAG: tRNA pseudouridine(38-40) synthase TruA [Clostridiales bacterium]|nr:tRNA pseudouridine(38-40) synthase TruA [Clostridiales bacterium]